MKGQTEGTEFTYQDEFIARDFLLARLLINKGIISEDEYGEIMKDKNILEMMKTVQDFNNGKEEELENNSQEI